MNSEMLDQSIDRLYAAFADLPRPGRIDGCACCLPGIPVGLLLELPLREISPEALSKYASSAFLTVGDVPDYLYFLPRILEISATEDSWWPDPEVTGKAIRAAHLADWLSHRTQALVSFNAAVIHSAIESAEYDKLDTWLCAIACMGLDVCHHLRQVANSRAAILAYFDNNCSGLPEKRLCNPFWELPCAGHDAIVEWFYSDEIRNVPFEAYGYRL